jgi:RNase P/RNase MRP subunit POP5
MARDINILMRSIEILEDDIRILERYIDFTRDAEEKAEMQEEHAHLTKQLQKFYRDYEKMESR